MAKVTVLASLPLSLVNFRLPLLRAIGQQIELEATAGESDTQVARTLKAMGINYFSVPISNTGINIKRDLITVIRLRRAFLKSSPDLFLAYTIKPVIYGSIAAKLAGIPRRYSLITGLGVVFTKNDFKTRLLRFFVCCLYKVALACNHKVIFQNKDDAALFNKKRLVAKHKVEIVNGSGLDLEHYALAPLPSKAHFLLIARLHTIKGVHEYIQAARLIKKRYPDTQFDIVGWIDGNPSAIRQAELDAWIEEGVINFLGKLEDVRPAIQNSSVYVLPSYREGTPRSVLEAMSMGRSIITTDAPGCRETVVDGENGFLVPVKDVDALVVAMEKFIQNPDLIPVMGKKSRQIAEEKYDVHKVNRRMLEIMEIC